MPSVGPGTPFPRSSEQVIGLCLSNPLVQISFSRIQVFSKWPDALLATTPCMLQDRISERYLAKKPGKNKGSVNHDHVLCVTLSGTRTDVFDLALPLAPSSESVLRFSLLTSGWNLIRKPGEEGEETTSAAGQLGMTRRHWRSL